MPATLKVKVDKQNKRVEVELGGEKLALTFEFLQQLVMDVMQSPTQIYEKDIPLK